MVPTNNATNSKQKLIVETRKIETDKDQKPDFTESSIIAPAIIAALITPMNKEFVT